MATFTFHPMAPGIHLMRRLRVSLKMAVMGTLLLLPLGALLVSTYRSGQEAITFTRNEAAGARVVERLLEVVVRTQAHRGISHRVSFGDEAAKKQHPEAMAALRKALDAVGELPGAGGARDGAGEGWAELRQALLDLTGSKAPTRRDELFTLHTRLIERVGQQITRVAEASGLLFDPHPGSHFMMDMVVKGALPWLEAQAVVRGQGSAVKTSVARLANFNDA